MACLLSFALVAAGCSNATPTAAPSSTPTTSPTPSSPERSYFSGRAGAPNGKVLAVKVDNTVNSHPQAGLQAADLVYVEQVEYGLTRFMAVYSSKYPKEIGPIRSARISDIALLRQFGTPAFAYSGSRPGMKPVIAHARLYNVSGDISGYGYWRQPGRIAPWNFWGDPKQLLKRAPKASKAHNIGFTFDPQRPSGGTTVKRVTCRWPYSTLSFHYSKSQDRWLLTTDGRAAMAAEGGRLGATTVIVQSVKERPSRFGKGSGNTPLITSTGKGKAWVFRNGRMWQVAWSRPNWNVGTTWTYRGKSFPMDPGQLWILLLPTSLRPVLQH